MSSVTSHFVHSFSMPRCLSEAAELSRLDGHFIRVLRWLHARPVTGFTPVQRRARAIHLQRLDAYRRRRVFPKNRSQEGFRTEGERVACCMNLLL